ncbi:hypothetical protein MXB_4870 [Myxobolus squamalis]|nr:hypothetical protein MXB_4870 [Myxobolus squamalis]
MLWNQNLSSLWNTSVTQFSLFSAKFIDAMMRNVQGVNDPNFVKRVPHIISLFKSVYSSTFILFTLDKEVFIQYHRVFLAGRLIDLKSNSFECEKSLVEELKLGEYFW